VNETTSERLLFRTYAVLALSLLIGRVVYSDPAGALFTEDFNSEAALIGRNYQAQTFLPVKHGHELPGWTKQGDDMPVHWVEQSPGNWALMLVANRAQQNIFTQKKGMPVNDKGHVYTVSLDAGPAVYAGLSQETAAGDQIAVELLRPDGTVLKKHVVTPGKWGGKLVMENHTFTYQGDGTGPLRVRLSPVYTSGVRFFGAIDHIQIFDSADAAATAIAARQAVERPARKQMAQTALMRRREAYASVTPKFTFAETLAEQEEQLKTNPLMRRFAESRKRLAADRYRPAYHFVSPESQMNDPHGLCFWQGRWHLFYQAYPPDEFPRPADIARRRQHWGHAVSDDLVHWHDLPYAIYPSVERMCFTGDTVVEEEQVVAFYPGIGAGQMVAVSTDPLLLNWEKLGGMPVRGAPTGDSSIWKEGDTYFGLVGADCLVSSKNLVDWTVHGRFLEENPFPMGDARACPNCVLIGNKHRLLSFSHTVGSQYLLGDYDKQRHRFKPYAHGRFNHGAVSPGGVHAPSATADGKGGVINILNINDGRHSDDWDQLMSLPQRLTLGPDSLLRIEPVEAVASLRTEHQHVGETILPANEEVVLEAITGNTLEIDTEIDPQESRWVQLDVLRSPNAEEKTSITFYNYDRKLSIWYYTKGVVCLDGSRSSTLPDVWLRPPERAVMERKGEPLRLRVFVDRSVVEVFVNAKLYLAMRVYPGRADSVGVSIRAQGQDAVLNRLDAWRMKAIWPLNLAKKP